MLTKGAPDSKWWSYKLLWNSDSDIFLSKQISNPTYIGITVLVFTECWWFFQVFIGFCCIVSYHYIYYISYAYMIYIYIYIYIYILQRKLCMNSLYYRIISRAIIFYCTTNNDNTYTHNTHHSHRNESICGIIIISVYVDNETSWIGTEKYRYSAP